MSPDGKIHGLFCNVTNGEQYMLLVNPHDEKITLVPEEQDELKGAGALKEVFGTETIPVNRPLVLQPLETKSYKY